MVEGINIKGSWFSLSLRVSFRLDTTLFCFIVAFLFFLS